MRVIRTGLEFHLLVMEFKTGPDNSHFRAALAQLMDYGSDLWKMGWEAFEEHVPLRYFRSRYCPDPLLSGCETFEEALSHIWKDMDGASFGEVKSRVTDQLGSGRFHYAILAQSFTGPILSTIDYLNDVGSLRIYAVEVVRLAGGDTQAFEARLIKGVSGSRAGSRGAPSLSEAQFVESFPAGEYRDPVAELIARSIGLGYTIYVGSASCSIRRGIPGSR